MDDKLALRARDFWTSLVLIAVSLLFLWQTSEIPFFKADAAGVDSGAWYNSAALIPYGVFAALLVVSTGLLFVAIKDGGASHALRTVGAFSDRFEFIRAALVAGIIAFYIAGLVPRVDFIIASALTMAALTFGFHEGSRAAMLRSFAFVAGPALYALAVHPTRDQWAKPHDDDWVSLVAFVALCTVSLVISHREGRMSRSIKLTPLVSVLAPTILVVAMAFGFRQNVPNRTGLLFSQIEYHYYVDVLPILRGQ